MNSAKSTLKPTQAMPVETVDCIAESPDVQGPPSTSKVPKFPLQFLLAITVCHKQHVIHQYAGMHQADNYSFAEYMVTEAKKVSDWSTRKKIELTRCGGAATLSYDYKGAKPVST